MLGHVSLGARDLAKATAFYDALLAPLGVSRVWTSAHGIGYGVDLAHEKLLIFARPDAAAPGEGFHLAFDAPSREAVALAYAGGMANGGTDNGPPGPRTNYSPTYYAAFLFDPEGWKLEIVHQ